MSEPVQYTDLAKMLSGILAKPETTQDTPGVYTHVWRVGQPSEWPIPPNVSFSYEYDGDQMMVRVEGPQSEVMPFVEALRRKIDEIAREQAMNPDESP